MRNKEDILIKDLLLEEMVTRKKTSLYIKGDLVAIQRTQFGAGLKLRPKFLGPYKVTKVNSKDRYEVEKVGQHEETNSATTSADLIKHFYA
ncbi:uncharacterized protein TNCV_1614331 [Trichonephila clavipes]|nr:uncharacterized protein TNCV_1614331 [Trichonephila clavipes]